MKAEFSENLRSLRKERGMSQAELAKRLGVNKSLVSCYENQERLPSLNVLAKLCYFFNVSMEFFLGIKKNKTVDVSGLTAEQISAVCSIIKQLEEANRKTVSD